MTYQSFNPQRKSFDRTGFLYIFCFKQRVRPTSPWNRKTVPVRVKADDGYLQLFLRIIKLCYYQQVITNEQESFCIVRLNLTKLDDSVEDEERFPFPIQICQNMPHQPYAFCSIRHIEGKT